MFIAAGMDVARGNVQSTVVSLIYGAGFLGTFSPWFAGYLVDRFGFTAPSCTGERCRCWRPPCLCPAAAKDLAPAGESVRLRLSPPRAGDTIEDRHASPGGEAGETYLCQHDASLYQTPGSYRE